MEWISEQMGTWYLFSQIILDGYRPKKKLIGNVSIVCAYESSNRVLHMNLQLKCSSPYAKPHIENVHICGIRMDIFQLHS